MAAARLLAKKAAKPGSIESLSPATILADYATDPARFAHDVIGVDFWAKQQDIAGSVARNVRTAARSGHKVGKTELAAALLLWWCCTRINARGIFTAPTLRQVEEALWAAVRRQAEQIQRRGYNIIPEVALSPSTGVRWEDGRRLFGFTASHPDKVSGPSGANILFVLDEASGIEAGIWQAVQGILGGTDENSGRVLAIGNPTQPSGWFYDAFNEKRELWNEPIRISSAESPNVISGTSVVPGLATRTWVREMAEEYGEDSPIYQVRVLGDFPTNSANQVIGLGLIEAALARWADNDNAGGTCELGVDVARFGDDDSCVAGRRGLALYSPRWFEKQGVKAVANGYDSKKVAGLVIQCMRALRKPGERCRIKIDAAGGYGGAVADELRAQQQASIDSGVAGPIDAFTTIVEVNVSESSEEPDNYPLLRDELWFGGRKFFQQGGSLFGDAKLEAELIAPIYSPTPKGQFKVEPKVDTKKRLGRSPDRADAALLAIYDPSTPIQKIEIPTAHRSRWAGGGRGF